MTERERLNELSALTPVEILNYFRNLYYNDGNNTEQGIVANAINDILPRMILPPCKVGDTVYRVTKLFNNETVIVEGEAFEFAITHERATKDKYRFYFWAKGEEFIRRQYSIWCDFADFGKTVFLTREEAEAALKERSKE